MQGGASRGPWRALAVLVWPIFAASCTTFSEDAGFGAVEAETRESLGVQPRWLRDETARGAAGEDVAALLDGELSADAAMQIALLNNPLLQAEYANLGISEADLVQAGRLANPGFSFATSSGGGAREVERGLHFGIISLLTMPARAGIETRRLEAARLAAAAATVQVALEARTAWVQAVSARQTVAYFRQVLDSAEASRDLMLRMHRVGNASRLDLDRERLYHAETLVALARAQRHEAAAREALARSLGLWGAQLGLRLPERLPELPAAPEHGENIEQRAVAQRLDIREARQRLDVLAGELGLTRATRFVNVLEAGPSQTRERGEPVRDGYEITLEIPIFDWGGARVARAEERYGQEASRLRAVAINARSQVREAWVDYRCAYDVARYYRDEIVPLRQSISREQLLRYNGMLIGVFELVDDARGQVAAVAAYLDALRDFWLAETALRASLLAGGRPADVASAGVPIGARGVAAH